MLRSVADVSPDESINPIGPFTAFFREFLTENAVGEMRRDSVW
jgi:hypothetical protein